jgi:hypothetical protein
MPWPTGPFYIMSQLQSSNYVLVPNDSGDQLRLEHSTSTIEQLWKATPDPRGGAFVQHLASGRVLMFDCNPNDVWAAAQRAGGAVRLVPLDPSDGRQRWGLSEVQSAGNSRVNFTCIVRPYVTLDVYNSDPNGTVGMWGWADTPNQWWLLLPETGEITVDGVSYDLAHAVADLTGIPPQDFAEVAVDNIHGGTDVTTTLELERVLTTTSGITHAESDTTSQTYSQTFSMKGVLSKVFQVSASAKFEESTSKTISLTDEKTESETDDKKVTAQVTVPPGKKYSYHITVYYGKVSVPYTATMTFQSSIPGSAPVPLTMKGMVQNVNAVRNEIVVRDETAPQPAVVGSVPVPLPTDSAGRGTNDAGKAVVVDAPAP